MAPHKNKISPISNNMHKAMYMNYVPFKMDDLSLMVVSQLKLLLFWFLQRKTWSMHTLGKYFQSYVIS
jgi:hypothetical protein